MQAGEGTFVQAGYPARPVARLMPEFNVSPLFKTLVVEGRGRRESFRGLVLAVGWWESAGGGSSGGWGAGGGTPELHYLVSDQAKPAPIWVEARQLTSQRWFPAVAPPADQPPPPPA
jgi:hypothetical protein